MSTQTQLKHSQILWDFRYLYADGPTVLVIALGADAVSVFIGRLVFALVATAALAALLHRISDQTLETVFFRIRTRNVGGVSKCD